jgi:hypothetical protein
MDPDAFEVAPSRTRAALRRLHELAVAHKHDFVAAILAVVGLSLVLRGMAGPSSHSLEPRVRACDRPPRDARKTRWRFVAGKPLPKFAKTAESTIWQTFIAEGGRPESSGEFAGLFAYSGSRTVHDTRPQPSLLPRGNFPKISSDLAIDPDHVDVCFGLPALHRIGEDP